MLKKLTLAFGLVALACMPSAYAADTDNVTVTATVTAYAHVDCANPSAVVLTTTTNDPTDSAGYTSSGAETISCQMLTNSADATVALGLSGAAYDNTNSTIETTHASVGTEHIDMELDNETGFASGGLLTGGTLTPNATNETASNFSWDVDVLAGELSTDHLAGSYTGQFTVTLSSY